MRFKNMFTPGYEIQEYVYSSLWDSRICLLQVMRLKNMSTPGIRSKNMFSPGYKIQEYVYSRL